MFSVIMAGGSGTRFWPASRKSSPKQFLDITGKGPMIVETCDRLEALSNDEETIIVLGQEHLVQAGNLLGNRGIHLVAEPIGRNTAPCIGLGAIYAQHLGCREATAFLPADHFIADTSSFISDLRSAGELAESGGIVTLGIVPTRPETGYGYIKADKDQEGTTDISAKKVIAFVEKPNLETAHDYLTSGDYYWNAGIFVATPQTIIKEIETHLPELYKGLMKLEKTLGKEGFTAELERVYGGLEGISFDYGIMEKTEGKVHIIPSDCGWSDVGSWDSLYELKSGDFDKKENLAEGNSLLIDCEKSFVSNQGDRFIACLGLKNCLIVDTPDALLVADIKHSQDVRKIVDELKNDGKVKLL